MSWIHDPFQWCNGYSWRNWDWYHAKRTFLSVSILAAFLMSLYLLLRDRPIGKAHELTREVSFLLQVTELRDERVQLQDMILLGQIVNHCESIFKNENPKPLAFHWSRNGLLCEGLTWYEKIMGNKARMSRIQNLRSTYLLKGARDKENDPVFGFRTVSYYELEYNGDHDKSSIELALSRLYWIIDTYSLWVEGRNRIKGDGGKSIDNVISNLMDLEDQLKSIAHRRSKYKLYLGMNQNERDESFIELEYQYIWVMKFLTQWLRKCLRSKKFDFISQSGFYWHKGLFCMGNGPLNEHGRVYDGNNTYEDQALNKVRDCLSEHDGLLVSLRVRERSDAYDLVYSVENDSCYGPTSAVRFLEQVRYLREMLTVYRGGRDISKEDHYMRNIDSLFSGLNSRSEFPRSMISVEFKCFYFPAWINIRVDYRVTDTLRKLVNHDCPRILNGDNPNLDENDRGLYELNLKDLDHVLMETRHDESLFEIYEPRKNHAYYQLFIRKLKRDPWRIQSAMSQIQWIVGTYESLTDKYDGMDKEMRDGILKNLRKLSETLIVRERRILMNSVRLGIKIFGRIIPKPNVELRYQYIHLMMEFLRWCGTCVSNSESLDPEFHWQDGLLRQGRDDGFHKNWEILDNTRNALNGYNGFSISLVNTGTDGYVLEYGHEDKGKEIGMVQKDIQSFLNQTGILHDLMRGFCEEIRESPDWTLIDKFLREDVPDVLSDTIE